MTQAVLRVEELPDAPLDAAAAFHHVWLAPARDALAGGDLLLVFAAADHTHRAWRLAGVHELAREAGPKPVNAGAGGSPGAHSRKPIEWLA